MDHSIIPRLQVYAQFPDTKGSAQSNGSPAPNNIKLPIATSVFNTYYTYYTYTYRFTFKTWVSVEAFREQTCQREVELRDFDAMELYRDAMSHGSWAKTAMRELGF